MYSHNNRSMLKVAMLASLVLLASACSKETSAISSAEAAPAPAPAVTAVAAPAPQVVAPAQTIEPTAAAPAASEPVQVAKATEVPMPRDELAVNGTKELAGKNVDPGQTFDYDTFNYAVVNGKRTKQGYPVYAMECHFKGDRQCVGEAGQALGSIADVAKDITVVSNKDVMRPDWYCDKLCVDSQDIIVGAVAPEMQAWLKNHPKSIKQ